MHENQAREGKYHYCCSRGHVGRLFYLSSITVSSAPLPKSDFITGRTKTAEVYFLLVVDSRKTLIFQQNVQCNTILETDTHTQTTPHDTTTLMCVALPKSARLNIHEANLTAGKKEKGNEHRLKITYLRFSGFEKMFVI